jgi:hypothetical protein
MMAAKLGPSEFSCELCLRRTVVVAEKASEALTPTTAAAPAEPTPIPPAEIAFERDSVNAIVVDENARLTHPLIKDAGKELRTPPADLDGIVHTPRVCVDVRVSKTSISRELRILQALFVAVDDRGYSVTVKDGKTFITVLGEPFRVFLKEQLRQTIRDLTPEEHRQRRQGLTVNPYFLKPSGGLTFYVGDDSYTTKATADGKKRRLDESLNLLIENLVQRAFTEKARRAERERAEEERRKAEERRKEEENRERHELAKRERFDRLAQHWRKNEERRAFLEALRGAIG